MPERSPKPPRCILETPSQPVQGGPDGAPRGLRCPLEAPSRPRLQACSTGLTWLEETQERFQGGP
eukprot:2302959-Pyramimonas_sp.AAC.1